MPYELSYKDGTFFLIHVGTISIEEINEVNGRIHGHEEFDSHKCQIIDLRDADFSQVPKKEAEQPGAIDYAASITQQNVSVAIITKDQTAIDFCEEYIATSKLLGSSWSFEIFPDLNAAMKWAGVLGSDPRV